MTADRIATLADRAVLALAAIAATFVLAGVIQ